jgi:uncharacterized protein
MSRLVADSRRRAPLGGAGSSSPTQGQGRRGNERHRVTHRRPVPVQIAFVDFAGERQYITQGNLEENPKAPLFLIDHAHRRRIKVWGMARVVEGEQALLRRLMPEGCRARPEQVVLFTVTAWDVNCPQHIPQRFEAADVEAAIKSRDERIATLEAEVGPLRGVGTTRAS